LTYTALADPAWQYWDSFLLAGKFPMLSTLLVWFIWLFLFIPVVLWLLGFVLPPSTANSQSTGSDTPSPSTAEPAAADQ
jgi:uncharacterized SAM-binding protein YcdF (DUF218 family)